MDRDMFPFSWVFTTWDSRFCSIWASGRQPFARKSELLGRIRIWDSGTMKISWNFDREVGWRRHLAARLIYEDSRPTLHQPFRRRSWLH
ncbi:hypothetical protein RchiOBHm_Chr7g0187431 [Rosa chinensis]|uniref:Uncharacterized protein n=1 Tax=Rosa chinensis TaxID=74649 RepID=A0A2P6P467_ROSCH|nr:hypothetical protein RchiOBHm_Chr7g0187431 [Rosa chinensis]